MTEFLYPTARDLFAANALSGLLAWSPSWGGSQYLPDEVATRAYAIADAMLAERKKSLPVASIKAVDVEPSAN